MTNNLITTFQGITVGDTINNPDVGIFTIIAINAVKDRALLFNTNPMASNRYIGAYALQKRSNGEDYFWAQGHYHGNDLQSATEYVLGIDDKKRFKYVVISCMDREIYKVGESDSPWGATSIMRDDFIKAFYDDGGTEEELAEIEANDGYSDDCSIRGTEAWLNGRHSMHIDWRIIEVEV